MRNLPIGTLTNLRRLTTVQYFPLSLPSLVNVTTLDITLVVNQINLADLLKDLSKMSVLEDLTLKLDPCSKPFVEPGVQSYTKTELRRHTSSKNRNRARLQTWLAFV